MLPSLVAATSFPGEPFAVRPLTLVLPFSRFPSLLVCPPPPFSHYIPHLSAARHRLSPPYASAVRVDPVQIRSESGRRSSRSYPSALISIHTSRLLNFRRRFATNSTDLIDPPPPVTTAVSLSLFDGSPPPSHPSLSTPHLPPRSYPRRSGHQIHNTTTSPPSLSPLRTAVVFAPSSPGFTDPTSPPPRMPPVRFPLLGFSL